jgi:DNA-binding NarL/FixJ family response regulator
MNSPPEDLRIESRPSLARARVLIVDDHPLIRKALAEVVDEQPDLELCGEAGSVSEALQLVSSAQPDIVLVDICLPGESGIELIKQISSRCKTIALSMFQRQIYAERAFQAGACDYVMKHDSITDLLARVRAVIASTNKKGSLPNPRDASEQHRPGAVVRGLSDRELDVFRMIGEGKSVREIATLLHLSPKTVETHRENIKKKMNLRSSTEVVIRAATWLLEAEAAASDRVPS